MPYDQGIDFRATAGFVTDPASCDKEIGTTANYPRASAQGNNVGWEDAPGGTRDRTNSVDARLAGIAFAANGTAKRYRLDLPSAGWYRITLALGDNTTAQAQSVGVYDGTTLLSNVVGHNLASAAGTFYDACGIRRSSAANWVANEVSFVAFFSSTICRIKIADTATASGNSSIAHVRVAAASAPSPSFNCGIDFRGTSAFVTDPTNCSPAINNFADYPHINAQGIVCGWEDAPNTFSDRSAAIDARLAGINAVAAGSTARFRIDLPASGSYRIEAAVGDATTAQPASGGNPAQRVEVFDGLTSLGTLVNNRQTAAGQWYDGSDTLRTSAANWVSGEAGSTWAFTGTTLRLKCGIAAGGSGSTTLSHVKVTQLTGITGTGSLAATLRLLRRFTAAITGHGTVTGSPAALKRFTATITGHGSLTAPVAGLKRFTATITGRGTLAATVSGLQRITSTITGHGTVTATVAGFQRFTATITGHSAVTATVAGLQRITATITGHAAVTATVAGLQRITGTITGHSTVSATVAALQRFTASITGRGTLSATISTGGVTRAVTATITGKGSLRAQFVQEVGSGALELRMDGPKVTLVQPDSAALTLRMDAPTSAATSSPETAQLQLRMDPPTLATATPTGQMKLRASVPILPATVPMARLLLRMSVPRTPAMEPSAKLVLRGGVPTLAGPIRPTSGRLSLRMGVPPLLGLAEPPTGIRLLKMDLPDFGEDANRIHRSGILLLKMDVPILPALKPPPVDSGTGVHLQVTV